MPKQVLLSQDGFNTMATQFLGPDMQFRAIPAGEFFHDQERLGLVGPGSKKGVQEKFIFYARGFKVVVLTTFIKELGTCRPSDVGRVLILEGDTILYMSRDIRRTQHFATRLLRYAWIAKWKIAHRPLCPECKAHMDIAHKKYRKHWWTCKNVREHTTGKPVTLDWDYGLPKKAKEFLDPIRKKSQKYRATRVKQGKTNFVSLQKRKTWTRTKKRNVDRS